jgi:hypothetical protein
MMSLKRRVQVRVSARKAETEIVAAPAPRPSPIVGMAGVGEIERPREGGRERESERASE